MKQDEPAHPIDIDGLRPDAVALQANLVPDPVQEQAFRRGCGSGRVHGLLGGVRKWKRFNYPAVVLCAAGLFVKLTGYSPSMGWLLLVGRLKPQEGTAECT
jgi:hypothetical protein